MEARPHFRIAAAVAFAGLLTAVLTSDTVRGWLESLVQQALNGS